MENRLPKEPFKNLALSLSGGGYRAASFHLGLITYLDSITWQGTSLLKRVRIISTVSGGTFTGVCYAAAAASNLTLKECYDKLYRFLSNVDVIDKGLKRLEDFGNWDSKKSRSLINALSLVYFDEFEQNTFASLFDGDPHIKEIIFNTTEFTYGLPFRFQKTAVENDTYLNAYYGNKQVNMPLEALREIRLADVIAASSCFPGGFEPINFPNDFFHKESPNLDVLRESQFEDKWGKKCTFPIGLMDGGIVDNQGIDSVINAEKRMRKYKGVLEKFASKDVKAIDLYIISDVSSPFMNSYVKTEEKLSKGWRGLSFRKFLLIGIILLVLALIMILAAFSTVNPFVLFISGFIASISIVTGVFFLFLSNIFSWAIRKFEVPEYFIKKFSVFTKMKFGVYETLIKNRITSVVSMVSEVFMKQVRRQEYGRVYNDKEWSPRLIMNAIYELSPKDKKETDDNERIFQSESIGTPGDELTNTAKIADDVGTTLWFTSEELTDNPEKRSVLNSLIACGQFTGCYNLIVYIEKTLWGKDYSDSYQNYPEEIKENIKNLHDRLLSDWKKFNKYPYWLMDEQYRVI